MLSLEQAVALPVATRQLADLGAEVIRVQAPQRARRPSGPDDLTRNKRQLGIDLNVQGASELFLRLAAAVDVVCHNFTPRVVTKFGIDYEAVRRVHPGVIYVSVTGFGMTGPWGPRPLFGPGAEAVSGVNHLIGMADAWPGRPGTIVYADNVCGLHVAFAILAALDHRDRSGEGQHIDASLYETSVSMLGPVLAEAALGAQPERAGNTDRTFALHDVFAARGHDRHVAVSAGAAQLAPAARALGLDAFDRDRFAEAVSRLDAGEVARRLQGAGVAAHLVSDASDVASDPQLWARGYFAELESDGVAPHGGLPWGGGSFVPLAAAGAAGADNRHVLREVVGLSEAEIAALEARGVIGVTNTPPALPGGDHERRIARAELSRVDATHDRWRAARDAAERTPGGLK